MATGGKIATALGEVDIATLHARKATKSSRDDYRPAGGTGGQLLVMLAMVAQTERHKKSGDAQRKGNYYRVHNCTIAHKS